MGFSFGSPSKTANNQTVNNADNRQQDNKIATNGDGTVLSSAGGALTNQAGALISGGGAIHIESVDPGSYQLASDVAQRAIGAAAQSSQAVLGFAASQGETTAKLAQGTPLGIDWKTLILPLAALAAVVGFLLLNKKGK